MNEITYNDKTDPDMVERLERVRMNGTRVRFHWGDVETGEDWGDTCHVEGTLGVSTGTMKIPLLIHNARSHGGMAILDHCIVKITTTRGKRVLYEHPKYHLKG